MRTITYGAACSLDGFIASRDGGIDWLYYSRDVNAIVREYWKTVDAVLMGRKTWEDAVRRGGAERAAGGDSSKLETYVFSRSLGSIDAKEVHLVRDDAVKFVGELKALPGRGICVLGGGELARSLFEADLIDEVGLNVHPVLLGAGVPLFRDAGHRVQLQLMHSRSLEGGCVYSIYRVRH